MPNIGIQTILQRDINSNDHRGKRWKKIVKRDPLRYWRATERNQNVLEGENMKHVRTSTGDPLKT